MWETYINFRLLLGKYPSQITFIGFPFKKRRLLMHFSNLSSFVPSFRYESVAIDQASLDALNMKLDAHYKLPQTDVSDPSLDSDTVLAFEQDRFGCSEALLQKRFQRNPFRLIPPYYYSCPNLQPMFGPCYNKHF